MFGLFKKKQPKRGIMVIVEMNAKCQPLDRAIWEDPLDELLQQKGIGQMVGGGTLLAEDGEVEHADSELEITEASEENIAFIIASLEDLGAPKGSILKIESEGREIQFGKNEGLGLYLNGTDLPKEVYANSDSNVIYEKVSQLIAPVGRVFSYWNGPSETAIYAYGPSFAAMQEAIRDYLAEEPSCEKCRVVQIA